ncbi:hypothetical protein ACXM5X_23275 [Pseudomonas saponiphila]|uniref:hypothetical protein n=1 Tax=Pseudomonas saponiphila TaxID=556534 RepID=UPI0014289D70|nr:hypothetical protein [Pseudomonas saponiphila]
MGEAKERWARLFADGGKVTMGAPGSQTPRHYRVCPVNALRLCKTAFVIEKKFKQYAFYANTQCFYRLKRAAGA